MIRTLQILLVSALLASGAELFATPAKRPNLVILVADDLGWNDVGYHGSDIRTPAIDRLAKSGVQLDRFYVCPICSPTRAGLLTGRYPHRFGLRNTVIPPWRKFGLDLSEQTLPEVFAKAGYKRRACIGKWHLGHYKRAYHPIERGFTHFYGHYNGAIDYFTHLREGERDWHRNFEPSADAGYSTELLGDEAVRFIKGSPEGEPFLLYLPFNAPHGPLQAQRKYLDEYGYDEKAGTFKKKGAAKDDYGAEGQGNRKRQTFAAMVTAMDTQIGRILDTLDSEGLAENSIVLFFSDNGAALKIGGSNKPLPGGKHSVHEGGVRVPAVIRWPAGLHGSRKFDTLMGYIDVLPTLLGLAGREKPDGGKPLDGIDLSGVLRGKTKAPDRTFYLGQKAVISQQWKLIEGKLYRIDTDPTERKDVSAANPAVLSRLAKQLNAFEKLAGKVKVAPYGSGRENFRAPADWRIEAGAEKK
ncbi:MAG: arylsulfatase [Planctomycetota bacterium]|jgi:arylsulfatase B|nr:arylsulfatase [Planctomycetota bacterium]